MLDKLFPEIGRNQSFSIFEMLKTVRALNKGYLEENSLYYPRMSGGFLHKNADSVVAYTHA